MHISIKEKGTGTVPSYEAIYWKNLLSNVSTKAPKKHPIQWPICTFWCKEGENVMHILIGIS